MDRLFSASRDGTIREWALGTWAAVRTVEAYGREERQVPYCLAVSGSKLISGSADRGDPDEEQQYEVRVWDLGTLECEHTLPQPAGSKMVWCLAAGGGAVWGGVGRAAVQKCIMGHSGLGPPSVVLLKIAGNQNNEAIIQKS
jgi:WD40 repeat protein